MDAEVPLRVQNGWKNWKRICGELGDPRGSCLTVVRSRQGHCRRHNIINCYIGYGKLQR